MTTLKCYCDLIKIVRDEKHESRHFCEALPTYLENGAHDRMILSLIFAGLSRSTAIKIRARLADDGEGILNSKAEIISWLIQNKKLLSASLPTIMSNEIDRLTGK